MFGTHEIRARVELPAAESWNAALLPLLRWLRQREQIPQHQFALLLCGGTVEAGETGITIAHDGARDEPETRWALTYRYVDREVGTRLWQLDVGISRSPDGGECSIALQHSLRSAFLGAEPPPPQRPVLPFLNTWIGQWARPRVYGGLTLCLGRPAALGIGQAHSLRDALTDPKRVHPIVYLSCGIYGTPLLDPAHLAELLAGTAYVVVASSPVLDQELGWVLPFAYRCVNGTIRVYQPNPCLDDERSARRHRYMAASQIVELGAEAPLITTRSIVRWAANAWRHLITSAADVQSQAREARLHALRARAEQARCESDEYSELLEEDNVHLRKRIDELERALAEARETRAPGEDMVRQLTYQRDRAAAEARRLAGQIEEAASQERRIGMLRDLPETASEMLTLIADLFPARVRVTERGRESAAAASVNGTRDVRMVWRLLHALATELYDLVFAATPTVNLPQTFRDRTGIELSLTESELTKASERLVALRQDVDDLGQPINITPHLKFGVRPPRLVRIHFSVDHERQLIVIGHCGDHLETASTRWAAA